MKNTHTCPKCNGTDIIRIPGTVGAYGVGNNIQTGLTNLSAVRVNRYLCCSCGYSEEWIDKQDIPKLEKKYKLDSDIRFGNTYEFFSKFLASFAPGIMLAAITISYIIDEVFLGFVISFAFIIPSLALYFRDDIFNDESCIEGEDIIYLCRTAMNNANNFHDSNYSTFHRIKNFRNIKPLQ